MRQLVFNLTVIFFMLISIDGFSWGERGHDIVSRVAVRLLENSPELSRPFQFRELMLGHLANVPDIYWRSEKVSESVRTENAPTHYVQFDLLRKLAGQKKFPLTVKEARVQFKSADFSSQNLGLAPWRVLQLFELLKNEFGKVQVGKKNELSKKDIDSINQALLYAGILSHFIGDLANPLHTTTDFDGWNVGQGGLHAFFESECVDVYPLTFEGEVYNLARNKNFLDFIESDKSLSNPRSVLNFVLSYINDSLARLKDLSDIDLKNAVLKPSRENQGLQIPAERKNPNEVAGFFQLFATQRLALAAQVLARLWREAWLQSGKPNMSKFNSYFYHLQPKFIPPPG